MPVDLFGEVAARGTHREPIQVREVALAGASVVIDGLGRVFCGHCRCFVELDDLEDPGTRHQPAPPAAVCGLGP